MQYPFDARDGFKISKPCSCDVFQANLPAESRRTGITLKEGKRDEHGMEEIEGMFSSPEKSPVKYNGFSNVNETIIGSEGMSMDEGRSFQFSRCHAWVVRCRNCKLILDSNLR